MRKLRSWFSGLSNTGKAGVILASLFVVGAAASPSSTRPPDPPEPSAAGAEQTKAESTETKTVVEFEEIPFKELTEQDPTREQGATTLKTRGIKGEKTVTYDVTIKEGTETSRKKISEEVTKAPINQVTLVGSKQPAPPPRTQSVQTPAPSSGGAVKKSNSGICHAPGTTYYDRTKNYTSFPSLDACLSSGGRLPRR